MDALLRHLRLSVRTLARAPLFTVTAVATLALGIGANTAIFSVVHGVLLEPLPYANEDRLLGLWNEAPGLGFDLLNQSPANYFVYREDATTLEEVALWADRTAQISGLDQPEELRGLMVTDGFFPVLGVQAALGRTFTAADDQPGAARTVMLTHPYWQRAFGGDPGVIGRTLTINGNPHEIVGVTPDGFRFLDSDAELFTTARFDPAEVIMGNFSYQLIARRTPDASIEQVQAELSRLIPVAVERFPGPVTMSMLEQAAFKPVTRPLKEDLVGDVRPVLWVLLGTVGMVLLIACANVANLLLVRAEGRSRDVAVRTALGAGRRAIAGGFLSESVVLGLVGGALGIGLAAGGLRLLRALGPGELPRLSSVGIDGTVLLFTLAVSVLAGLLFGLFPVLRYGKADLAPALKEGGRSGTAGREKHRARNALAVGQVALALVLLVGSGLMIRSFQALRDVDPGFSAPEEVFTFRVTLPSAVIEEPVAVLNAYEQMVRGLEALPGVRAVSAATAVPMSGSQSNDPIYREEAPTPPGQIPPIRRFVFMVPGWFQTLGVPLVAGRDLEWSDLRDLRHVVVVSESFARENYGDARSALGRRVSTIALDDSEPVWQEIVGVVGDVHHDGLDQEAPATMYWPMLQENMYGVGTEVQRSLVFTVRADASARPTLLERSRQVVWSVAPSAPLAQVRTLQDLVQGSLARTSFTLVMLGIAALVALLLGAIGLYGVISYGVSQRTKEMGLRIALGAEPSAVTAMVVRQGVRLSVLGVAAGLIAAFGLARLMDSLLFGVEPVDLPTYAVVSVVLAGVAVLASWLPARRAAGVDPATALRAE
ncbi:MAG: ABC transporter permease [Gemmatimonadota bacterium]|nr:ABC transporter permease [Gemmatimonadota bacterium]